MSTTLTKEIKNHVAKRANYRCEYCQYPEEFAGFTFEVDHIRPRKHLGTDDLENLCYCCPTCNRAKGTNISTYLSRNDDTLVRLFHPRRDRWEDHLTWEDTKVVALTPVGAATVQVLNLNNVDRLMERLYLG